MLLLLKLGGWHGLEDKGDEDDGNALHRGLGYGNDLRVAVVKGAEGVFGGYAEAKVDEAEPRGKENAKLCGSRNLNVVVKHVNAHPRRLVQKLPVAFADAVYAQRPASVRIS